MKNQSRSIAVKLPVMALCCQFLYPLVAQAQTLSEAIAEGSAYGDFRLRYEQVEQENSLEDAEALTLRSRLGYRSGEAAGFSALVEFEDSRAVAGLDDYNDGLGSNPGYSTIADPESTELAQAYLQFSAGGLQARGGRQLLTLDNHRFLGHVGWRQNRQTFDAFSANYTPVSQLSIQYNYIGQRNRILAAEKDVKSKDQLLNIGYQTPIGKISSYAYLLEEDDVNALSYDNYGLRFSGDAALGELKWLYQMEYATQERTASDEIVYEADYYSATTGLEYAGFAVKLGYEVLGSDEGQYGFTTPLATLHKFNGWADQFLKTPEQGLLDASVTVTAKHGIGKFTVSYHEFEADEKRLGLEDFGTELDVAYSIEFAKYYYAGVKYASYRAADIKVDTDKYWAWVGAKF